MPCDVVGSSFVAHYNYTPLSSGRDVITRVNNQLLKLMSILDEQSKLNPKGTEL